MMNREKLIDKICPCDATNNCFQGIGCCKDCDTVINAWLDEYDKALKADIYREFDKVKSKIKHIKAELQLINTAYMTDYTTGHISALSTVEGILAEMGGE